MPEYCFYEDALPEWDIHRILLAEDETGAVFFPVRTLCDALKIDRPTQSALIQADSRTLPGARTIKAPTRGGVQPALYLRRREVAIWLTGIDPPRVGGRARGRLDEFQQGLWQLAERTVFRRRMAAEAGADEAGEIVQVTGAMGYQIDCACGRRHIVETRDGVTRVWHLAPERVN